MGRAGGLNIAEQPNQRLHRYPGMNSCLIHGRFAIDFSAGVSRCCFCLGSLVLFASGLSVPSNLARGSRAFHCPPLFLFSHRCAERGGGGEGDSFPGDWKTIVPPFIPHPSLVSFFIVASRFSLSFLVRSLSRALLFRVSFVFTHAADATLLFFLLSFTLLNIVILFRILFFSHQPAFSAFQRSVVELAWRESAFSFSVFHSWRYAHCSCGDAEKLSFCLFIHFIFHSSSPIYAL